MSFVYIIQSETSGRYYIGYTKNLEKRVIQHQQDKGGWTKRKGPWILRYFESFDCDTAARKREIQLKKKKRPSYYTWLISNGPGCSVG